MLMCRQGNQIAVTCVDPIEGKKGSPDCNALLKDEYQMGYGKPQTVDICKI